jgi:uncharacterized protein
MVRLDRFTRAVERGLEPVADFDSVLAHERAISPELNGRTVLDDRPRRQRKQQMSLFE